MVSRKAFRGPVARTMGIAVVSGVILALAGGTAAVMVAVSSAASASNAASKPNHTTTQAPPGAHGITPAMAACQQRQASAEAAGKPGKQCNPAALAKLPFSHPDPSSARLLSESEVLAHVIWRPGDRVGIARLTYGKANAFYPELAADSGAVAANRVVWVITTYFPKPETIPFGAGWAPPGGHPATQRISKGSVIIDALTGQSIDSCAGCAAIPASAAATRAAALLASKG